MMNNFVSVHCGDVSYTNPVRRDWVDVCTIDIEVTSDLDLNHKANHPVISIT